MILEPCFSVYNDNLGRMAEFINLVTPVVVHGSKSLSVLVESAVVLTVAYAEDFLASLVGTATREREDVLREYFRSSGNEHEQRLSRDCDIPTLAQLAKRRVSFKREGAPLESIFDVLFSCSPWPAPEAKIVVLDLVRARQVIIHQNSSDLGGYAGQMNRREIFRVTSYGDLKVYHLYHLQALLFLRQALIVLQSQMEHLRARLTGIS